MNARELVTALKGRWYTSYGLARCPAHDDGRDPALSITDGDKGNVLLKCFAGCEFTRIASALRALGLWDGGAIAPSAAAIGIPTADRTKEREAENERRRRAALDLWHQGGTAIGSPVETYLCTRGILIPPPPTLRYLRAAKHTRTGLTFGAMVAAIATPDRYITGVHRTFLNARGDGKAGISDPKLALGIIGSGAVHLAPAGETLGIAEGIETALSAMQLFAVPVWAACGSWLEKVAVPDMVKLVIVFADSGEAGEHAAERAAKAHHDAGRRVDVRFPTVGDWNDALRARGAAA